MHCSQIYLINLQNSMYISKESRFPMILVNYITLIIKVNEMERAFGVKVIFFRSPSLVPTHCMGKHSSCRHKHIVQCTCI